MEIIKPFFACILVSICLISCKETKKEETMKEADKPVTSKFSKNIDPKDFEKTIDGEQVKLYVLTNKNGMEVTLTNYGQRIVSVYTPDKNGNYADVVLGFSNLDDYMAKKNFTGPLWAGTGTVSPKANFPLMERSMIWP